MGKFSSFNKNAEDRQRNPKLKGFPGTHRVKFVGARYDQTGPKNPNGRYWFYGFDFEVVSSTNDKLAPGMPVGHGVVEDAYEFYIERVKSLVAAFMGKEDINEVKEQDVEEMLSAENPLLDLEAIATVRPAFDKKGEQVIGRNKQAVNEVEWSIAPLGKAA